MYRKYIKYTKRTRYVNILGIKIDRNSSNFYPEI